MTGFLEPGLIDPASRDVNAGQPIGLLGSRCPACGRVDFPRRPNCSACNADAEAVRLDSKARLGPQTAVLHAPPGGLVEVPYRIGVAEFPEGIAVMGLLVGSVDVVRGDEIQVVSVAVGDRLTYGFEFPATA